MKNYTGRTAMLIEITRVEQRGIRWRIGYVEIVHGIDNPFAHELRPQPVDHDPGKERMLRRGQPRG